jgi:hypothetical protein
VLQNEQKDVQTSEPNQVLFLRFGEENEEEEEFTPVVSRKTRKKLKSAKKIQRSMENNGCKARSLGAQSGFGAAQGKATDGHPVCDIVTGPRVRRKNPKYL